MDYLTFLCCGKTQQKVYRFHCEASGGVESSMSIPWCGHQHRSQPEVVIPRTNCVPVSHSLPDPWHPVCLLPLASGSSGDLLEVGSQCLSSRSWHISHSSAMSSGFIRQGQVSECPSCLRLDNVPSCEWTMFCSSVHLSTKLGCSHFSCHKCGVQASL